MLKSKIFPYDENLRASEVQKWLDALVEARMLIPIINDPRIGGSVESYYVIRTFRSHQKFDARYPNYLIDSELLEDILGEKSESDDYTEGTQRVLNGDTKGTQHGKGKGNGKGNITPPPTPAPESGGEECDEKTWKNDFEAYKVSLRAAYKALINDKDFIAERERYHPGLNIKLSLEKACKDFWATEAGWKRKKRSKIENIDWKATLRNALDQKCNHVWLQKNETNETGTAQKTVGYV